MIITNQHCRSYPGPERGCSEATGERKRAAAEIRRPSPGETDALAEVLSVSCSQYSSCLCSS